MPRTEQRMDQLESGADSRSAMATTPGENEFTRQFYRALGEALRRSRDAQGLTQETVAKRVGLSRASIANIERGAQQVALHQYLALAAALERNPDELLAEISSRQGAIELVDPKSLAGLHDNAVSWVHRVVSATPENGS